MTPKYSPSQTVYLSGANASLIEEAVVIKHADGFYTIRFAKRPGGTRVREGRLYATRADAESALPKHVIVGDGNTPGDDEGARWKSS